VSKPLTMTVEREAWIREHGAGVTPQSWQPGVTMLRDLLAEVDALRAALAAAESDVKRLNAECEMLNNMLLDDREKLADAEAKLADERKQLTAALEDERRHADMLHRALHAYALNDAATGTQPPASALAAMDAHAARRNAEKEVKK